MFMLPHDREYVETMMADDYDPHLEVSQSSGDITQDEKEFYKWYKKNH